MLSEILDSTNSEMNKAYVFFDNEIKKIRAGKASPDMLNDIKIDYYGTPTPLQQVGSVSVMDTKTLTIQPWEKDLLEVIEKAIMSSNLGITPQNDGIIIRLFFPPLTEERRKEIFKRIQQEAENCKIALRNIRRDKVEKVKKSKEQGVSEDQIKEAEEEIQSITGKWSANVDKKVEDKQKDIMTV